MSKLTMRTNKAWGDFLAVPGFKKYFANTSWLMAEKIFCMAVALSVGVYVVRYLGPERFGVLSYAMSFVVLFSAFSTLGLNGILVRELVNFPEKREELLGTVFILKLIGSGIVFILLSIVLYFMGDDRQTNLMIFVIAAGLLFQSFNVIKFYFEAKVLSKYFVVVQFVSLIVASIAKLIFIWLGMSLIYFALAVLIESIILAVGLVTVYSKQSSAILNWLFEFKTAIGLLKDSWPLMLSGAAVSVYMRIDQVMIKHMLDSEAVGQYAAAVKLSEIWYFIPMIICSSLFPAILNARTQSKELYYTRLQALYDLFVWIAVPLALIVTFVAGGIVKFVYGKEFARAGTALSIHIWAGVFVFIGVASSRYLIAENYTGISFFRTVLGMIVNVILNIILIPKYSINGAAIATLLSYAVAAFSMVFFVNTRQALYLPLKSFFLPLRVLVFQESDHEKKKY